MTAIWDKLAWISSLEWKPYNQDKVNRLKQMMNAIYIVIKDRPEYKDLKIRIYSTKERMDQNLLELLRTNLEVPVWGQGECELNYEIVQRLHDFDHSDVPINGKSTHGHHTELLFMKRANKEQLKIFKNIHLDCWWETGSEY